MLSKLLISIFLIAAQSTSLYINNTYAGSSGTGTSAAPFQLLSDALSSIADPVTNSFINSNVTLILNSATTNSYNTGQAVLNLGANTAFTLTGDVQNLNSASINCSALPIVEFSTTYSLSITNNLNVTLDSDSLFIIQGINIFVRANSTINQFLVLKSAYNLVSLRQICVTEETTTITNPETQFFYFSGIQTVLIQDSVILNQTYISFLFNNISNFVNLTNLSIGMGVIPDDLSTYKLDALFNADSTNFSSQFVATNLTVGCDPTITGQFQLTNLITISFFDSISIDSLEISKCNASLVSNFVVALNSTTFNLSNFMISNLNLTTFPSSIQNTVFFNIIGLQSHYINNITFDSSNFSYVDIPTSGYGFDLFYFNTDNASPDFVLTSLNITNTNYSQAYNKIMNVDITAGIFNSLSVTNVLVNNSYLDIRAIFRITLPSAEYVPSTIVWRQMFDWTTTNTAFYYCYILDIDGTQDSEINLIEKEFYSLRNWYIHNSSFNENSDQVSDTFLTTQGAFLNISNLTFSQSQLLAHDGIGAKTNPSNFILTNSQMINNHFAWSFVHRNSIFTDPSVIYFVAADFFTPDLYFKRMNRAVLWQNVSVINNTFTLYAELIHDSAPLIALYNCTFINNSYVTEVDRLANVQPYYTFYLGWGYPGFIDDPVTEELLYSYDSVMLDLLHGLTPGTAGIPSTQIHRYIFENVLFDRVWMGDQASLITFPQLDIDSCGIHFYNVTFSNYLVQSATNFTTFVSVSIIPYFRIENCNFQNLSGYGILINVADLVLDCVLLFNNNTVDSIVGLQLLTVASETLTTAQLSSNQITNIFINQTVISLTFQELYTSFEFSSNILSNISVYSSELRATSVNLFLLQVERAVNGTNTTQSFFSCNMTNITMNTSNEFANGIASNSLFLIIGSQGLLNMTNLSFQNISIANSDPVLLLSSYSILLDDWKLEDVAIAGSSGVIGFIFESIQISNSIFQDVVISSIFGGPLIYLASTTMNEAKFFASHNTLYINITSQSDPILSTTSIMLGFDIQNCTFKNNFLAQEAAFSFVQAAIVSFNINNVIVMYNQASQENSVGSFLYFEECTSYQNASASINNMQLKIDMALSGYFFSVSNSRQLLIQVANFTFAPSSTGAYHSGVQYGILQASDAWVEFTSASFSGYTVNQTYPFMIGAGTYYTGTRLLLSKSNFENIILSNFSATSSIPFSSSLLAIESSTTFCPHDISIISSTFSYITSWDNGTIIQNSQTGYSTANSTDSLTIEQSSFSYIKADYGGVIFSAADNTKSSVIAISSSKFLNNLAYGEGGAIWSFYANLSVTNTSFTNNTAILNGGAIFVSLTLAETLLLATNAFQGNDAIMNFGDDYASPPDSMQITFDPQELIEAGLILTGNTFYNVSTESLANLTVEVSVLDNFGQTINDYSTQKSISFYLTSSFQYRVFTYRNCTATSCDFIPTDLEITGLAGEATTMRIEYLSGIFTTDINYTLIIRPCLVGEINDTSAGTCSPCPQGKYSLSLTDEYCSPCVTGASCPGGSVLIISPGYWRANTSSDVLVECPTNQTCVGGSGDDLCQTGYSGPVCQQCDAANSYSRNSDGDCSVCAPVDRSQISLMLISLLGLCTYQLIFIVIAFSSNRAFDESLRTTGQRIIKIGPCIALFLNYSQIMSIVFSLDSSLQDTLKITDSVGDPASFMFLTLDCVFYSSGFSALKVTCWKVVISCLDPIGKWVLFQICLFPFQKYFKKQHAGFKMGQLSMLSFITLFVMEQPGIIRELLSVFNCETIDPNSDTTYMVSNVDVACDSDEFEQFKMHFVIPFLVIWGAVIPGIIFWVMYANNRRLKRGDFRIVLGGLYNQYKENAYYWGIITVLFKETVLLAINGLSSDENARIILAGAILILYYSFLKKNKPYHHDLFYDLEVYSINCSAWSVLLILLRKDSSTYAIQLISIYTLAVINILMVFYFCMKVGSLMFDTLQKLKIAILKVLKKICPCFFVSNDETAIRLAIENATKTTLRQRKLEIRPNATLDLEKDSKAPERTLNSTNSDTSLVKDIEIEHSKRRPGILEAHTDKVFDVTQLAQKKMG